MQDGAIGRDQLSSIGCDWNHWSRAKRNGRWKPTSPRVLVLEGTPTSDALRVRCAVLDAGPEAVLHGGTALGWVGLRGFDLSRLDVARASGTVERPTTLARVHVLRELRPEDRCRVRGIPSVTPLRAIWSEASRYANPRWHEVGRQRIGRLLDDANVAGLLTWCELNRSVEALQERGRAGTRLMRELAVARPPGSSPTESRNEDRLEEVLGGAGATLERQRWVGGERPIGRTDFLDGLLPLVVEVNSLQHHSSPSDQRADEGRYEELLAAGFSVAVVWEDDLWSHPGNVREVLRESRRTVEAGRRAVIHSASCPWPHDARRWVIPLHRPGLRG